MSQFQKLPLEDHIEHSRITHELMKQCWGVNFSSPIDQELTRKDFKVLDVACGISGEWLLQLSKEYPLAKFVGLDVIPVFPVDHSQDNLQFIQGDILKGLPFEDNSFDFVHMRFVMLDFSGNHWEESIINELVRVCKPGGWIELLEIEESKFMGPTHKRLTGAVLDNLKNSGESFTTHTLDEEISELLDDTSEIDTIYVDERFIPIGNWGGDIGKLALKSVILFFRVHNLIKLLRLNEEEYQAIMEKFVNDVERYHTQIVPRRLYCQKNDN